MTAPMTRFSGLPELARIAWGRIPPTTRSNFRLVLQPIFCFISFNRPSTPLYDAQLGGYFYAHMPRLGSNVA
jgi:hypothetical protein